MRLSEAIFLGSKLIPQAFGQLYDWAWDNVTMKVHKHSSCALGSAMDACGEERLFGIEERYPWAYEAAPTPCPACSNVGSFAVGMIPHLNDTHRWSREKIADWVASIEPKEDPAPVFDSASVPANLANTCAVDK